MNAFKDKSLIEILINIAKYDRNELDLTKKAMNIMINQLFNQQNITLTKWLIVAFNIEQSTYEQQRELMDVAC